MHSIMPREREIGIGMGQKGITVSMGCVAIEKCQDGKCLGKGSCGECALLCMARPLWGESKEPEAAGQDTGSSRGGRGSRKSII